jgi:hypothetical protein
MASAHDDLSVFLRAQEQVTRHAKPAQSSGVFRFSFMLSTAMALIAAPSMT